MRAAELNMETKANVSLYKHKTRQHVDKRPSVLSTRVAHRTTGLIVHKTIFAQIVATYRLSSNKCKSRHVSDLQICFTYTATSGFQLTREHCVAYMGLLGREELEAS